MPVRRLALLCAALLCTAAKPVAAPPPVPTVMVKLETRRNVYPQHPDPQVTFARCSVRVFVDLEGKPYHTDAKGCPQPFLGAAERAVLKWRFEPYVKDGAPIHAATLVTTTFLRDAGSRAPSPPPCRWDLVLGADGSLSPGVLPAPDPCAGWFPDHVSPGTSLEELSGACQVTVMKLPNGNVFRDRGSCAQRAWALADDVLDRTTFGKAESYTIVIDMLPTQ